MDNFEKALTGGHPNSLGNTVAVVEVVLEDPSRFDELFNCYYSEDPVVRLRVSNAMKRIGKANKTILVPYADRLIEDISKIDQASTQWTLAQLFLLLEKDLSNSQFKRGVTIVKNNLEQHQDWIVLNESIRSLVHWSKKDEALKSWLIPQLRRLSKDPRKSVSNRAAKSLLEIAKF